VPTVRATTTVPGRVVDAEALWYDPHRWAAWIDGFGHVAKLEGDWPQAGARLLWDSRPQGRGRVSERVTEYEPHGDEVLVSLTLEYRLKERSPITPLLDLVFIRRALRDSLQRTLERFGHERRAEVTRT
jgi:hypothetical protein